MVGESSDSTTLTVHLNRTGLHSIDVPESFASADSFVIELENHGEGTHVHLRLDEALSGVASVPSSNHYVRPGATTRIPVSVSDPGPAGGTLTIATAYGSQTETVPLTIEPNAGKRRVKIDESLIERSGSGSLASSGNVESTRSTASSAPRRTGSTGSSASARSTAGFGTPALLGAAAVVVIVGIVLLFLSDVVAVYIGALAVLVGVIAAAYLVLY
ncbi:hypothetical protein [Halococcus sp. IIIV-5B]|uniref:DUF7524 family protein n=1 Tax=Halococcus sp. IIIV-5B TaxID=2321230 RepID=UPI000E7201EA|nr:hypothetical protein [Halococcus sp. IIIV-5B]RJT03210.1 hypothetical protein D3261_12080 [Halococcus sp. IIIV-5B]